MDLPEDPEIGIIGHIIDEDIALLENFRTDSSAPAFCIKVV